MEKFSVRDLREYTGKLTHDAEQGQLSWAKKHGKPVFIAVPYHYKYFQTCVSANELPSKAILSGTCNPKCK